MRDPDAWERTITGAIETFGGVDVLVNNARAGTGGGIERETVDVHKTVLEEIAHAAMFFASDESSFCTGASLVVDGGHIAGLYRDPMQGPP
ncbi:MAG: SDR family oxidoreductase [Novosphingobium sp.]